ncbi:MAG: hypothetical protein HC905_18550 [Bacteroidales bacterium]|nr:hypothetical protein [Bacteroidales bacterium]
MKKLFILTCIILISIQLNAQKEEIPKAENTSGIFNKIKFDKAHDLFNRMAYSGASKLFEELEPSGYRLHDVIAYLGNCYYYLGNTEKAEYYLWQTVSLDSINPLFYYKYAQVLRSNKKYEESDKWMIEYSKHTGKDQLQENLKTPENSIRMAEHMGNFAIENRKEINSPYSDFGAITLGDRIIFTSGRSKSLMIDNSYAWNDKPFLDLYQFIPGEKQKHTTIWNAINTRFHEGPAVINNNHSIIYFTRNSYIQGRRTNSAQGTTHLMLFTANAVNGKWTNIRELPFNNKEYSVGHPALSPDGKRLYFASNMPGSLGGTDIFMST